jgi:HPt (histidine-containing phosphotransfer) domain-containing protein
MSAVLDDESLRFADVSGETLRQLQGACWRGDLDQLGRLAHRLHGAAAAAGAGACRALCSSLEAACQRDDMRRAVQLVQDLGPALTQADDRLT